MIIQANAKINWVLDITGCRSDGYHFLDMIMQRIDLHDTLHAEYSDSLSLSIEGNPSLSPDSSNLVMRAACMLRGDRDLHASLHLIKRIPTGAGLGGGSADAAAALLSLNQLWKLGFTREQLSEIALKLGADVPFFLQDSPARVKGIGEEITALNLSISYPLIVIKPSSSLSTGEVYRLYRDYPGKRPDPERFCNALINGRIEQFADFGGNSLSAAAEKMLPQISDLITRLQTSGACYACMTGSGSAVFGVFESLEKAEAAYSVLKEEYTQCFLTKTL